jgi:DNA polymerase I-like protein with 3'-5' exonuclease and polymerase domains
VVGRFGWFRCFLLIPPSHQSTNHALLSTHRREYFEDENINKVWHNYSFDRHVLHNHGIDCKGFGGDTMHMTRLWEAGRQRYSLQSVSSDFFPKEPKITIKDR